MTIVLEYSSTRVLEYSTTVLEYSSTRVLVLEYSSTSTRVPGLQYLSTRTCSMDRTINPRERENLSEGSTQSRSTLSPSLLVGELDTIIGTYLFTKGTITTMSFNLVSSYCTTHNYLSLHKISTSTHTLTFGTRYSSIVNTCCRRADPLDFPMT